MELSSLLWATSWLVWILVAVTVLSYLVFFLLDNCVFCEQNLKAKYGAEWALVTGASSGIGRAITEKLAQQDINVVMVALDDALLTEVHAKFQAEYPDLKFLRVGCNLGRPGYLEVIQKACHGLKPNLIFNNAGFIRTGLFADLSLEAQMANYECNATSPMVITHHFLNQMLDAKQRGAITFTSSPAGLLPNPSTAMYGATKAFLTEFAASIAPEVKVDGIDVLVVHPSPVDTGFYSGNTHGIDAMKFFQKTATSPQRIASCFFRSLGRTIVHDQGYFPIAFKFLLKIIDFNCMAWIISMSAGNTADYKKSKRSRGGAGAGAGGVTDTGGSSGSPRKAGSSPRRRRQLKA